MAFENHTAWSEYEVEMQAQLQRQREVEAVEELDWEHKPDGKGE